MMNELTHKITPSYIKNATGSSFNNANKYFIPLTTAMSYYKIDTISRISAFLATITIESASLRCVEENLFYTNESHLANTFKRIFSGDPLKAKPFIKNPNALSKLLYQGFHGRGLIQLTWEKNYRECGVDLDLDLIKKPELLCEPLISALSAGWYWSKMKCNLAADNLDMDSVTRIVNGPARLHLSQRIERFENSMDLLA